MHELVKVNVEEYLAGSDTLPRELTAHLAACEGCRRELAELKAQSAQLRVLRTAEEFEPMAGFYGRVIERIDSQRQSSIWSIFLEPAFGRRLAVASAVFAVLMGAYLVGSEPDSLRHMLPSTAGSPTVVLPGEDEPGRVLDFDRDRDQDRGAVLVNLATYQERP